MNNLERRIASLEHAVPQATNRVAGIVTSIIAPDGQEVGAFFRPLGWTEEERASNLAAYRAECIASGETAAPTYEEYRASTGGDNEQA